MALGLPPSLSNLLELDVFDGQVLSCDLIAGEVKLSSGQPVPSDAAVEVCDGQAQRAGGELAARWVYPLELLLQLAHGLVHRAV